jgi:hypothetical protein
MPYRRRYYWRRRRQTSPQEKADQTSRELYWQVRREISNESEKLRLRISDHLICGMTSAIASAAVVALLFWYLFSFVFPIHPLRVSHYYEMGHAVFVLAVLVSAVYFPGNILNYYLWPKILKIAGFIVVAVAFYFGLKGRANHLYIVPYFLRPESFLADPVSGTPALISGLPGNLIAGPAQPLYRGELAGPELMQQLAIRQAEGHEAVGGVLGAV